MYPELGSHHLTGSSPRRKTKVKARGATAFLSLCSCLQNQSDQLSHCFPKEAYSSLVLHAVLYSQDVSPGEWKDDSVVKSTCCSHRGLASVSSTPRVTHNHLTRSRRFPDLCWQILLTLVKECGYRAHMQSNKTHFKKLLSLMERFREMTHVQHH